MSENQVILRLAEQYLIRAEARARIGTDLSGALADLNVVHQRAGLTASITLAQAALLDEIALENRKEFFCEQGIRWYNLKRTGQADAVLTALKASYRPNAKLYPIAQSIINSNPNLIQNAGY
jgi:dihydroorotase